MRYRFRDVGVAGALFGLAMTAMSAAAQDDAALRKVEQLGAQLYVFDRAARIADAQGQKQRGFRRDEDVAGWVAEARADGIWITFVGRPEDGGLVSLYRIGIDSSGKELEGLRRVDPEPVGTRLTAQFHARQRAAGVERMQCSNTEETLVLPGEGAGNAGWYAYVLPRAAFPDVFLLGGSVRVDVAAPGDTVLGVQPLASDCVVLQNTPKSRELLFAEDRASTPNELHVYLSLLARKPLYVTTTVNGLTWLIQDGHIRPVAGIPAAS